MPHPRWLALFMLTCLLGVVVGETCYRLVGCFSLTSCRAKDIDDGAYDAATAAMFGTSVTHHALHTVPLLYGATANLTTVGATTLAGDLAMLERMVERNIPLQTVFILAIPEIFGSPLTANDERRRIYFSTCSIARARWRCSQGCPAGRRPTLRRRSCVGLSKAAARSWPMPSISGACSRTAVITTVQPRFRPRNRPAGPRHW